MHISGDFLSLSDVKYRQKNDPFSWQYGEHPQGRERSHKHTVCYIWKSDIQMIFLLRIWWRSTSKTAKSQTHTEKDTHECTDLLSQTPCQCGVVNDQPRALKTHILTLINLQEVKLHPCLNKLWSAFFCTDCKTNWEQYHCHLDSFKSPVSKSNTPRPNFLTPGSTVQHVRLYTISNQNAF